MYESQRFRRNELKHRAYHSWQLVFRNPADFTRDNVKSAGFHECELLGDDQV